MLIQMAFFRGFIVAKITFEWHRIFDIFRHRFLDGPRRSQDAPRQPKIGQRLPKTAQDRRAWDTDRQRWDHGAQEGSQDVPETVHSLMATWCPAGCMITSCDSLSSSWGLRIA